ncbi:MAG: subclass B1 metallo-beta-lactamase, partial [Eudoraea sp.]|nr:subclass B1 metallo-beta-lactamase [Eudoraea sp.]
MTKVITRFLFVPICILLVFCKSPETDLTYRSETLQLIPVAENAYIHISYIALANGDRFACNGLVYINDRSAIVFDTPADRRTTTELIRWLTVSNPLNIEAVVVNHFHDDCLGGIEEFHERGVMSYASSRTLKNITDQRFKPNKSFEDRLTLKVGNRTVVNRYFGEAHSRDNIISYFPDEELLFGGCMIKAL